MFIFLFFEFSITSVVFRKQKIFNQKLNIICKNKLFSEVEFDLTRKCEYENLIQECKLWNCIFPETGPLDDVKMKTNQLVVVDLLKNPESFTGYKDGAAEIWKKLRELNSSNLYKTILSGIQQSVNLHKAAFYKKNGSFFLKNIYLFKKTCYNLEYRENLEELFFFLLLILKKTDKSHFQGIIDNLKEHIDINYDSITGSRLKKIILNIKKDLEKVYKIIDCMNCQKCRIWSTVQFNGLYCGFKVLSGDEISKNDMIFFLNLLNRINCARLEQSKMDKMSKHLVVFTLLLHWKESISIMIALLIFITIIRSKNQFN